MGAPVNNQAAMSPHFLAPATAPGRQTTIATRPDGPRAARKAARTAPVNNQAAMKLCIDFILKPWSLASSVAFLKGCFALQYTLVLAKVQSLSGFLIHFA